MAVAALVDQTGRGAGDLDLAIGGAALRIVDRHIGALHHGHIAVFEIGDAIGERREREGVGTEIGGIARHSRPPAGCPPARRSTSVRIAGKDHGERIGAGEAPRRRHRGLHRVEPLVEIVGDEMGGDFGVGFGFEFVAFGEQFFAQFAEILDDAVMHDRYARGGMGMGVAFGRRAMGRPARVADTGAAGKRICVQHGVELATACRARGGARYGRSPASRYRPNRSRDIPAAAAHR